MRNLLHFVLRTPYLALTSPILEKKVRLIYNNEQEKYMFKRLFYTLVIILSVVSFAFASNTQITILHTNDIHGNIGESTAFWMNPEFPPPLGGAASLASLIKEVRTNIAKEEDNHLIVIDAGDFWQGTPVGEKSQGRAVLDYFELAEYDMIVLGNHDFDKGVAAIKEMVAYSKIPFVTANLRDPATGEYPEWENLQPYMIMEKGGIKVGIIGIITDDMPTLLPAASLEGIEFLLSGTTIMKFRDLLKNEMGCDLIVVAAHTGISYNVDNKYKENIELQKLAIAEGLQYGTTQYVEYVYEKKGFGLQDHDLTALIPGIDVLVGGHSHQGLYPPYEDPRNHTLVIQAYSKSSALGRLDLVVDDEHKQIIGYKSTNYTPFTDNTAPDKAVKKKVDEYIWEAEKDLRNIVAVSATPITRGNDETLLGSLIADAMKEEYRVDFVLFNRGGMRADLPAGQISGKDVYQTLPFGNTAVVIDISGRDIIRILQIGFSGRRRDTQISGARVIYNPDLETKNKLCWIAMDDGTPIDLDKTYKMATSNYLSAGAVGYQLLTKLPQNDSFTPLRDVLSIYLKKLTPLARKLDGRIKRDRSAEMDPDFQIQLDHLNDDLTAEETPEKKKEIFTQ